MEALKANLMKEEKTQKHYLPQFGSICFYILVVLISVAFLAYMHFKSHATINANVELCEDKITTYVKPADMFILIDASRSLRQSSWQSEKSASVELVVQMQDRVPDLQVGFLTFTGHWEGKNEETSPMLRDVTNLGSNLEVVKNAINDLPDAHYLEIGTNFHEPLLECKSQLESFGREDSYKLCVLMTDGVDMSFTYHGRDDDCARGCTDPMETASDVKMFNDTKIMTIYAGSRQDGVQTLFQMSSCSDYDQDIDDCLYFTHDIDDEEFSDFHAKISNITEKIVDEITLEEVECVKVIDPVIESNTTVLDPVIESSNTRVVPAEVLGFVLFWFLY